MEKKRRIRQAMATSVLSLLVSVFAFADNNAGLVLPPADSPDSTAILSIDKKKLIHQIGAEVRPGYVFPTHAFLKGDNETGQLIRQSLSAHLRYSFRFRPDTYTDRIYGGVYQGLGLAYFSFGERHYLGDPLALYLFQGARIAKVNNTVSFNYEWNFGLSAGWHPYDPDNNSYNKVIGSEVNAYLNMNFYLQWKLSRLLSLTTGVDLTHFSNGNTKYPNSGLNTVGLKIGLVYSFDHNESPIPAYQPPVPEFHRHISYDLVVFGSWRRKGVPFGDEQVASPDAYTVVGFNFAPMYNFGYKLRAGISVDGVYDGSANVYTEDYIVGTEQQFYRPSFDRQIALGLSARVEYVMPYFTVNLGVGGNVLHRGGDLGGLYQVLALKIEVTRNSFIHIGYNLQNFHTPNYLMLGIGYRFHNKYPTFHR